MGTRSLTVFMDNSGKEIAVLYRQYDGYPSGHGIELAEFLKDFTVVNGMGITDNRKIANGMDCLACQIIARFKTEPGGFYLYPAGSRNCGEEFIYILSVETDKGLRIKMYTPKHNAKYERIGQTLQFEGSPAGFLAWVEKMDGEA
jgi:hypothetical protein